jgi:hypothetical protein
MIQVETKDFLGHDVDGEYIRWHREQAFTHWRSAYGAWSIFAIAQEACHCGGGPATIDLGKMGCLRLLAAVLSVVRLVPLYFPERLDR